MYLFINTSETQKNEVALLDPSGRIVARKNENLKDRRSNKLLSALGQIFNSTEISVKNLKGILVVEGPGPFSAVRIGVVTANILSFDLGIPIEGVRASAEYNFSNLVKKFREAKTKVILPFYGKEPNITLAS